MAHERFRKRQLWRDVLVLVVVLVLGADFLRTRCGQNADTRGQTSQITQPRYVEGLVR
jgi:hypothetical protein